MENPTVNSFHLFGDGTPGVLLLNQLPTSRSHFVALRVGKLNRLAQCVSQLLDFNINPPSAAMMDQVLPGRPFGSDHRDTGGKCFGNHESKILAEARQDKEIGSPVDVPFRPIIHRADERELVL
jgi:hypothetical protein